MTRTALLQLLDHPTAIAPAEVQELEQLARAFPYCQTAHLLLAKAAHDQGTMLASQRLRRAATYAADRVLLRQLIEQVVEKPETAEPVEPEPATALVEQVTLLPQSAEPQGPSGPIVAPVEVVALTPEIALPLPEPALAAAVEATAIPPSLPLETQAALAAAEPIVSRIQKFNINQPTPTADGPADNNTESHTTPLAEALAPEAEPSEVEAEATSEIEAQAAPEEATELPEATEPEEAPLQAAAEPLAPEEAAVTPVEAPAETEETPTTTEPDAQASESDAPEPVEPETLAPEAAPEELPEPEIPATAPPIRPPEEAGSARFEYGLHDEPKPAAPLYELPLVDEWAAAATPLALAGSDDLTLELPGAAPTQSTPPKWTAAAFTGDATLGYALDEGSRLGFGLGLLTEALLEKIQAEHESTLAHEIVAAPRPAPLPPTDVFFEPDVLLLEHWATHRPVVPPTPSSSELINSFLRRQPRLTRPAMLPPAAGAQADLSVKSTRPEPELATEGLARILARQGKIDRAIEIYQRLMVKQPEKMAYFAAQIQQLQPSA